MTVSKLDKQTALIVIDLQKGIVAYPTVDSAQRVVQNAVKLRSAFKRSGLDVILVNVAGMAPGRTEQNLRSGERPPDWSELVPELTPDADDYCVTKKSWGAFTNTSLLEHLHSKGITQVVIVGIATSIGVESTARQAYEFGFNVVLVQDAMTDMNADAQLNSLTRIFPRLGEVGMVDDIIGLLPEAAR